MAGAKIMQHDKTSGTFSDALVASFAEVGITNAFVVTGGAISPFTNSLAAQNRIRVQYMLTEQSAGIAAEAFGYVDNSPALVVVTSGPGVTNAITAVAASWTNSSPMIVISGQARSVDVAQSKETSIRQVGNQHVRTDLLVNSIVKHFYEPTEVEDPFSLASDLLEIATHGRPGPVWLSLSQDLQRTRPTAKSTKIERSRRVSTKLRNNSLAQLNNEILLKAKRPAILIGNGARKSINEIAQFAKVNRIPVMTTWPGMDMVVDSDPIYVGRPGAIPSSWQPNLVCQNADLLLVFGARLDLPQVGYNPQTFASSATVIRVDVDPLEFARIPKRLNWFNFEADIREFVSCNDLLNLRVGDSKFQLWWDEISRWAALPKSGEIEQSLQDGVSTYHAVELASKVHPSKVIVTGSSGTCVEMLLQSWSVQPGQRIINSTGIGSMGFGVAAAIGVSAKFPNQTILCIESDGSFAMNLQDIYTISGNCIPIHIIILNSQGYKSIELSQNRLGQISHGNKKELGLHLPDINSLAESISMPARTVESSKELLDAINWLAIQKKASILNIIVSPSEEALPRLISRVNAEGKMESPPMGELSPNIK